MTEEIRGTNDPDTSEWELREELEAICRAMFVGVGKDDNERKIEYMVPDALQIAAAMKSVREVLVQLDTFRGKAGECMHPGPATFPFTFNGLAISIHCSCCGRWRSCEPVQAAQEWIEPRGRAKTLAQYQKRSSRVDAEIKKLRRTQLIMQPPPAGFDPKKGGN